MNLRNLGTPERAFRLVAGLLILGIGFQYRLYSGLLGLLLVATGLLGYCPTARRRRNSGGSR